MLSLRLKKIANMIPNNSRVVDIGCDHALLDIYLVLNKNCTCVAADVNISCLEKAKENINVYSLNDKIDVVLSDGFENIEINEDNYVVIAGMGTANILKILDGYEIRNLIIQTNKDLEGLRKSLSNKYSIVEEEIILDKQIYYVITKYKLGKDKLSLADIILGKYIKNNDDYKDYCKYILDKNKKIYKGLPKKYLFRRLNLLKKIMIIKKYC